LTNSITFFPGPKNVASVISRVTSSQRPWQRYVVGYDAYFFSYPLSCLPDCFGDFFCYCIVEDDVFTNSRTSTMRTNTICLELSYTVRGSSVHLIVHLRSDLKVTK